uniref:G_PROTEIN_RECEP_F2_3 domain-containing protein n=1 Tax=Macrostomum lignano TaxID=282301 RepID=A0A1I8JNN2_9PLAT
EAPDGSSRRLLGLVHPGDYRKTPRRLQPLLRRHRGRLPQIGRQTEPLLTRTVCRGRLLRRLRREFAAVAAHAGHRPARRPGLLGGVQEGDVAHLACARQHKQPALPDVVESSDRLGAAVFGDASAWSLLLLLLLLAGGEQRRWQAAAAWPVHPESRAASGSCRCRREKAPVAPAASVGDLIVADLEGRARQKANKRCPVNQSVLSTPFAISIVLIAESCRQHILAAVFRNQIGRDKLQARSSRWRGDSSVGLTLNNKTRMPSSPPFECCGVTNQTDITGPDTLWTRSHREFNGKLQTMPVTCCRMKATRSELLGKQDWNNVADYLEDPACPNTGNGVVTESCYKKSMA